MPQIQGMSFRHLKNVPQIWGKIMHTVHKHALDLRQTMHPVHKHALDFRQTITPCA